MGRRLQRRSQQAVARRARRAGDFDDAEPVQFGEAIELRAGRMGATGACRARRGEAPGQQDQKRPGRQPHQLFDLRSSHRALSLERMTPVEAIEPAFGVIVLRFQWETSVCWIDATSLYTRVDRRFKTMEQREAKHQSNVLDPRSCRPRAS